MAEGHVRFGTVVVVSGKDDDDGSERNLDAAPSGLSDVTMSIRDDIPGAPPPLNKTYMSPPPPSLNGLTPVNGMRKSIDKGLTRGPDDSASSTFSSKELRRKLTREHSDRDPLFYYEVLQVLGVGSMGSVARVRKRTSVIGGSARQSLQTHFRKEKRRRACFQLPFVGGFFQHCVEKMPFLDSGSATGDATGESERSRNSSILVPAAEAAASIASSAEEENSQYIYAMKSIHLSRVTDEIFVEELKNEVAILRDLDHPHIVKAIETFEHRKQLFMVMELCSGGDLYARDPYSEEEAARIISSILSAISYMHSRDFAHRDLKYENVLFVNASPKSEVKLIDFGLSKAFGEDELTEGVGTIYTMAPEVLKGSYTKQADLWSVGVMAFMLLSSQMPFYGRKRKHIVEQIMAGKFEFKGRRWRRISEQAKDFVSDLLVLDPDDRATAEQALSATWLNRRFTATVRNPHVEEMETAQNSMVKYANYSKLKKVALMVVAHRSTSEQIGILRKVFQKYDTQRDGQLNYAEFKAALKDAGISETENRKIFDSMDLDGTGRIRYTEFLAATIEAQGAISEERLAEAFDRLDADDSGFISKANLIEMLGDDFPQAEIDAIIAEVDIEKDGHISYAEFLALWEDQNETKRANAMNEIRDLLPLTDSDRSVESASDLASEPSGGGNPTDIAARASFLQGKKDSERKVTAPPPAPPMDGKHVLFRDTITTMPNADNDELSKANG